MNETIDKDILLLCVKSQTPDYHIIIIDYETYYYTNIIRISCHVVCLMTEYKFESRTIRIKITEYKIFLRKLKLQNIINNLK